jgi:hypothetical protein
MSEERRYRNDEIREILELADRDDLPRFPPMPQADGLTASELQEVGREVGLSPGRVARAVAEYEGRGQPAFRSTTLGMPTQVGRMVSLPRAPTDQEWELLVAELRTTFGEKGEVAAHGGLREWSNGNLHAFIEPTESGYRLRLTDTMVNAIGATFVGGFFLAFALLILLVLLGKGDPGFRYVVPGFFSVIGVGLIAGTRIALPRWADRRDDQMQHVMGRARALIDPARSADAESDSVDAE